MPHNKACSPLPATKPATHYSPTAWNAASRTSPSEAASSEYLQSSCRSLLQYVDSQRRVAIPDP
eukprot:5216368-Pyramimonas_sp.AAC.1